MPRKPRAVSFQQSYREMTEAEEGQLKAAVARLIDALIFEELQHESLPELDTPTELPATERPFQSGQGDCP
jgi:hypothetical protein